MKRRYWCEHCKFLDSNWNPSVRWDRYRRKHCIKYGHQVNGINNPCEGFESNSPCDFSFKIKRLNFEEVGEEFQAQSIFGIYHIKKEIIRNKLWMWCLNNGCYCGYIDSFEEAKDGCQRDMEDKIIEGLDKVETVNLELNDAKGIQGAIAAAREKIEYLYSLREPLTEGENIQRDLLLRLFEATFDKISSAIVEEKE